LRGSGANDFIQKPFEIELLIDSICKMLDMETTSAAK